MPAPDQHQNSDPGAAGDTAQVGHKPASDFVWPPIPSGPTSRGTEAVQEIQPKPHGTAQQSPPIDHVPIQNPSIWRVLERSVLGASMPSIPLGWKPEPADDACPRCAGTVGLGEAGPDGCAACQTRKLAWAHAVRLGTYAGSLRNGVIACKYRADRAAGQRLGKALGERVAQRLGMLGLHEPLVTVVPVPTTRRRRLGNGGLDHSMILARGVAAHLGCRPACLLRRKHGPRQAATSARERAKNVQGMFSSKSGRAPAETHVLVLVDDVRTTGATASACFQELVKVFGSSSKSTRQSPGLSRRNGAVTASLPVLVLATASVSESRRTKTPLRANDGGWGTK